MSSARGKRPPTEAMQLQAKLDQPFPSKFIEVTDPPTFQHPLGPCDIVVRLTQDRPWSDFVYGFNKHTALKRKDQAIGHVFYSTSGDVKLLLVYPSWHAAVDAFDREQLAATTFALRYIFRVERLVQGFNRASKRLKTSADMMEEDTELIPYSQPRNEVNQPVVLGTVFPLTNIFATFAQYNFEGHIQHGTVYFSSMSYRGNSVGEDTMWLQHPQQLHSVFLRLHVVPATQATCQQHTTVETNDGRGADGAPQSPYQGQYYPSQGPQPFAPGGQAGPAVFDAPMDYSGYAGAWQQAQTALRAEAVLLLDRLGAQLREDDGALTEPFLLRVRTLLARLWLQFPYVSILASIVGEIEDDLTQLCLPSDDESREQQRAQALQQQQHFGCCGTEVLGEFGALQQGHSGSLVVASGGGDGDPAEDMEERAFLWGQVEELLAEAARSGTTVKDPPARDCSLQDLAEYLVHLSKLGALPEEEE
eukprot:TRINITY_DN12447_c0_g1_i1.p1 TRINITY_DN12447_c0_g1~~TRINITY_DN12447_c0_g1_i1.p1  ORF type:complete len:476 (-),score=89.60 TRINITY_DN12447_c0_g1_i1:831-2258(-)